MATQCDISDERYRTELDIGLRYWTGNFWIEDGRFCHYGECRIRYPILDINFLKKCSRTRHNQHFTKGQLEQDNHDRRDSQGMDMTRYGSQTGQIWQDRTARGQQGQDSQDRNARTGQEE
jgi:hypothetical protein